MKRTAFPPLEVKGKKFDCWLDSAGMFCTDLDGECISRDSLKKLTQVITDHVSKKKVQVPFLTVSTNYNEDLELAKGVALSIHSGNGNVMVLMDGEHSAEQ